MNIRPKVTRVDHDDTPRFELVEESGACRFWAIREDITRPDGTPGHGHWILYMDTPLGGLEVDRDQYSNDLIERVEITLEGVRPIYGHRFKVKQPKPRFSEKCRDYIADLEMIYGGEWVAEYYEWEGKGVLTRKAGT